MGLLDKVKNLFTEEVEEEIKPIKKDVRRYEVPSPKPSIEKKEPINRPTPVEEEKEEPLTREEKFVFFSDDDFKDLEKPKIEPIKKVEEKKEEKPLAYKGVLPKTNPEPKKEFKPSPIISPVYGVLDKNYRKEEIRTKKSNPIYRSTTVTIDDVRNKAYGTLEDEIKEDLLGKAFLEVEPKHAEADINIFEELDKYEELTEEPVRSDNHVDELFDELDNKKDEIIEELDIKKDEILDEIDTKKYDILNEGSSDVELAKSLLEEDLDDYEESELIEVQELDENEEDDFDDTDALAQELEEQKKKLEEISELMNENEKVTKTKTKKKKEEPVEDDLEESELFDLIDSMYEKKDDE